MATITTVRSGNWSDTSHVTGPWPGGATPTTLPTNADDVVVANTHTLTVDAVGCVGLTLTINATGHLTAITSAPWTLVIERAITQNGTCSIDMSGVTGNDSTIIFNNSNTNGSYSWRVAAQKSCTLKGTPRKRWTLTRSALTANTSKTVDVDDATGWQATDILVFCTTGAYAWPPLTDKVTIATITAVGGGAYSGTGAATITWTDGTGTTGAVANGHLDNCIVGNFSSNLTVKGCSTQTTTTGGAFSFETNTVHSGGYTRELNNVTFTGLATGSAYYDVGLNVVGAYGDVPDGTTAWVGITDCAMYNSRYGMSFTQNSSTVVVDGMVFYDAIGSAYYLASGAAIGTPGQSGTYGVTVKNSVVFRHAGGGIYASYQAQLGSILQNNYVSGCACGGVGGSALFVGIALPMVTPCTDQHVWSCAYGLNVHTAENLSGGSCGAYYSGATNTYDSSCFGLADVRLENMNFPAAPNFRYLSNLTPTSKISLVNKNSDVTSQEIYQANCTIKRNNSSTYRSTSSIEIAPTVINTDNTKTLSIPCANGASIRVIGYTKKSHASNIQASVSLSGLGSTWGGFTDADNTNWQVWDTGVITNSSGADGNYTLTYTARSSSGTTNTVLFDGVPDSPFITKCRHYGYTYDETNPVRTTNITVSANEAAALLLGDTEITVTAATSAIALNANRTFQQVYDYTQAWACTTANLGYTVPLTGAGVADSASLFAVGNITTTGYTLDGGGTLNIPSGKTLTASLPFVYTYTNGTYSKASSGANASFSGGTLNIGAAGTYTYVQAAAMILSMTPTAPGTYALGETTFTGEVDLRNTAAHAITVELPTGASYTTASNTGGTITVSLPVVTADISITSMPDAGAVPTRLQIINSTATGASTWVANTVYATGAIVKRTTGLGSESTAGLYFRATTGGTSHATTEPTWDTTVGNTTADNTVVWTTYAILYYDDDPAATSLTDTYIDGEEFLDGESVEVRFAEMDGSTSFKTYSTTAVVNSAGFSVLVSEDADDVYATNALDGSDYEATFSPNFTLDYMVLDTNTDFAGKAAFAYYCYTLTTSAGMWGFWGGVTALDEGNYRVNTAILNLYFDESAGFVKQTDDVRIYRDDGTRPAIDPTTGGHGIEINWRTPVSVVSTGGSALTPAESAYLLALPSASANATAVITKAVDGTTTLAESLALSNAVLGGKVSGAGTGTETFRDLADTKDRVVATVDTDGNRTAITRDLT